MLVTSFTSMGEFGTNCYAVESEQKNAVMIDCPCMADRLYGQLQKYGLTLKKILLTHGHIDHILAAGELSRLTGAEVFIHEDDLPKITDTRLNLAEEFGIPYTSIESVKTFADGDTLTLDEVEITVLHTPGHTPGSVCFFAEDFLFSGDTLFAGSIGRTDFIDGDFVAMSKSLAKLNEIEGEYTLLAGHGPQTTLSAEKKTNMYLLGRPLGY